MNRSRYSFRWLMATTKVAVILTMATGCAQIKRSVPGMERVIDVTKVVIREPETWVPLTLQRLLRLPIWIAKFRIGPQRKHQFLAVSKVLTMQVMILEICLLSGRPPALFLHRYQKGKTVFVSVELLPMLRAELLHLLSLKLASYLLGVTVRMTGMMKVSRRVIRPVRLLHRYLWSRI